MLMLCIYLYIYVCVCVCVCIFTSTHKHVTRFNLIDSHDEPESLKEVAEFVWEDWFSKVSPSGWERWQWALCVLLHDAVCECFEYRQQTHSKPFGIGTMRQTKNNSNSTEYNCNS